jgi:predicted SnoaL-like aldol condensation-catalyzing enzyme
MSDDPIGEANKALVRRVFEDIIDGGRLELAAELLRPDYIQHNPSVGQGVEGFVAYFTRLDRAKKRFGIRSSLSILHMLAENDSVFIHSTTRMEGIVTLEFETMDLFRVQEGRLAEHWDVIQGRGLFAALALLSVG